MKMRRDVQLNLGDLLLRIGLVGAGLILWEVALNLWLEGQPMQHPLSIALSFAAWAVGVTLLILALVSHTDSRLTWLVLVALVLGLLAYAYLQWLNYSPLTTYHTDNEMITEFATQALKQGENPYTWNFSDMLRVFRDSELSLTPFLDGAPQNRVTYPALPILTLLGFDLLGIGQVRIVSLLFHILLLVLIFVGTPRRFRAIFLLPLFLAKEFVPFSLGGIQDVVWSTLLVGMILSWKRPVLQAVLFGLAAAFRQQPWFVAPFLLIYMWNEPGSVQERWRRILHFLAVSVGVFIAINLPFILWDPAAWALGAFEPVYAKFDVISIGLGALTQRGLTPYPREFYTALQISSYLVMLIIYWRHPRSIGQAFWVFPGIFFWVYYRGLPNYWIYWIPPLLLACVRFLENADISPMQNAKPSASWAVSIALVAPILFANLLWGFILLRLNSPIEIHYALPLETIAYGQPLVSRIKLTVANKSDAILFPRFAAQRDASVQALPWSIESGPERLDPGQAGDYVISADSLPAKTFAVSSGGQIVVTDAGGNYWLRAVLTIPPDPSFANPDLVVNPNFSSWGENGNIPDAWALEISSGSSETLGLRSVDGRAALLLRTDSASAGSAPNVIRLKQTVTFPTEFALWVYPIVSSTDPMRDAYGLELDDGEHRLWVLFGDADASGALESGRKFVYLRSPLKTWTRQTIDTVKLYDRFAWQLPAFSRRNRNGLQYLARQVQLSLLLISSSPTTGEAIFGAIEQSSKFADPATLLRNALARPDVYYTNLGDEYRRQRNYDLADSSYMKALSR